MPASHSREPSPHQYGSPIDSPRLHHWKRGEDPHLHTKDTTRAKLERLRSVRLMRRDLKVMKLNMQGLER
jgi:hypothetical protein